MLKSQQPEQKEKGKCLWCIMQLLIQVVLKAIKQYGVEIFPQPTGEILVDMDDLVFYEVAMEKRDDAAYLVTGNQKHYPVRDFIVTLAEMMEVIEK